MKKLLVIISILALLLSVNGVFADNDTYYVSNDGSDSLGNGTIDNPYQTLNYTIDKASNNSNIYLKSGTYNSTGYDIVNKSITITGVGEVTIDGLNGEVSENIFKINNGSSLVLNNIRFINGKGSLEGSLSPITNEGNLTIKDCNFNNFTTINGAVFNKNSLTVDNISESELRINWDEVFGEAGSGGFASWIAEQIANNPSRGEFITNIGDAQILNSKFLATVYNNRNMIVSNSYLEVFVSNRSYDLDICSIIDKSKIMSLKVSNNNLLVVNNSFIDPKYDILYYTNAIIQNSTFFNDSEKSFYSFRAVHCNISIKSSSFNKYVSVEYTNMNITHSTLLGPLSTGYDCYVNANYNWWGDNKGPKTHKNPYSTFISDYWIVMIFSDAGDSNYNVEFAKYTNGVHVFDLHNASDFNSRFVKLETESGRFLNPQGYLENGSFKSKLVGNNENTVVYAKVDNQVLNVVVGVLTDYEWYISDDLGNDYFCDGSYENPYKTLSKVVSKAFSGNTIYIMEGVYTLSWNANIQISKNLTFEGLGNAVLSRPNARNIFRVDDKGILNINNISFTTHNPEGYFNALIYLNGGEVNIRNSRFYDARTEGIILSDASSLINLDNVTFERIEGYSINGNSSFICVNNSRFLSSGISYNAPCLINVNANIDILNSNFENNKMGIACLFHKGYSNPILLHMDNCTIQNNDWKNYAYFGINLGVYHSRRHAIIDNSRFINNLGHLVVCDSINNSTFINNTDVSFDSTKIGSNSLYEQAIIHASELINNSYFYGNSLPSRSFEQHVIYSPNVYNSVFINNKAAYGGALSNPSEVHYCVFLNNTGIYGADDIFVYNGVLNASGNWWGSNQKPDKSRVEVFLGSLILENWVVMNLTQDHDVIIASLDTLLDDNKTFYDLNHSLPSRSVVFYTDYGKLNPNFTYLVDNYAHAILIRNTSKDFDVYAIIDNQKLSLTVYNNSTEILVDDTTLYGKDNKYKITLINVNGHKISNQLLNVIVTSSSGEKQPYTLTTDSLGVGYLHVDYPIGVYDIEVIYYGNGYFEKSSAKAIINVSSISTSLYSHDYTYWGKNNIFYAVLTDASGRYLLNESLIMNIYDLKDKLLTTVDVMTGTYGKAEVLLSLDVGSYKIKWDFLGNEWYEKSSSLSLVTIKPINTTLTLPNATFFGKGNDYEFTFTDIYGNIISDETVTLKISNATDSKEFKIIVKNGVGTININLLPGVYNLEATYLGDEIYGPGKAKAVLDIQKVFLNFEFNSYTTIPENGVFSLILKDMYGKKVGGQNLTLELYDEGFYKSYNAISDANGELNFKIDAPEGIYFAIISFYGSTWYKQATAAATIDINHEVSVGKVYINASDYVAYYGENKYYTIKFNDTNKFSLEGIEIPVIISSGDFSKAYDVESDVFGNVRLQITLDPGEYDITYKYENKYYNIFDSKTNKISIYKMPTSLIASDIIVKQNDIRNFEVKLINKNGAAISNLPITITIDDKQYNASTNNFGVAKLPINLELGYHNVNCLFENVNYISSTVNSTILVVDESKAITTIESSECYGSENNILNYTVMLYDTLDNPLKSSQIILNLTDGEGNFVGSYETYTNSDGEATFYLNLTYDVYQAKTYYSGNEFYFESFNTNYIYISPLENVTETILFGNDVQIINGYNGTYSVVLKTIDGDFISNASIEFIVKGNSYFATTDDNGRAYLNAPFKPGTFEVKSKYSGGKNLTRAYVTNYINVVGELVYMFSQDVVKSYNDGKHYYIALFDSLGQPLSGKLIKFNFNNETIENITDNEGFACFELWLNPGEYNITAQYQGAFPDEYVCVSNNITVLTTVIGNNITKYYGGSTKFCATFLNFNNEGLADTDVIFNINGVNYKVKTDENGLVMFNINLRPGNYKLTVLNTLTGQICEYNVIVLTTLTTTNLAKYYKGSEKFKATFKDKNGNLLKNTNVKFTVSGKTYTVKTNKYGVATLNINLRPGKYTITTLNTKTNEKKTNTITVKKTIITSDKKVKVNKKIKFQAKILKSNGQVAKKVTITIKINKKTYKIKTNNNGVATLNIKLKKGTYTITTTYNGLSVNNKVRVVK